MMHNSLNEWVVMLPEIGKTSRWLDSYAFMPMIRCLFLKFVAKIAICG